VSDPFAPDAGPRAPWLVTLADLALLLAGFLVLVQATRPGDRAALAQGMRERFGDAPAAAPPPVAVQATALAGFAAGSADAPPAEVAALVAWAREQLRDPRVRLNVAGTVDGSAADRDPGTGSAAVLAADRARAAARAVAAAVPDARMTISADPGPRGRRAWVSASFAGERP
jgi:hypothetical protein